MGIGSISDNQKAENFLALMRDGNSQFRKSNTVPTGQTIESHIYTHMLEKAMPV